MVDLRTCRLYGILDTGYCSVEQMPLVLERMIQGGIDLVQLRAKHSAPEAIAELLPPLLSIAKAAGLPFIVNDFPHLAAQATGCHIGQDDGEIAAVRATLPPGSILGKSTHSYAQAIAAAHAGADYIGFGPLFPTPTKAGRPAIGLEEIRQVHEAVSIPIFCIGGIKRENLPKVIAAGAQRVVIVSGILQAIDIPGYISDCKALLSPT
jgi:thiamine-phosphate pyrophosphorylase